MDRRRHRRTGSKAERSTGRDVDRGRQGQAQLVRVPACGPVQLCSPRLRPPSRARRSTSWLLARLLDGECGWNARQDETR